MWKFIWLINIWTNKDIIHNKNANKRSQSKSCKNTNTKIYKGSYQINALHTYKI